MLLDFLLLKFDGLLICGLKFFINFSRDLHTLRKCNTNFKMQFCAIHLTKSRDLYTIG